MKRALSVERLREVLDYNPDSGLFTRKVRTSQNMRVGDAAGTYCKAGYRQIGIDGVVYYAHRLAIFHVTGVMPAMVDHINGVRDDNRLSNLRPATARLNQQNRRRPERRNKTGLMGVSKYWQTKKYEARINVSGTVYRLGTFLTPEEAAEAYIAAKRQLHPGCTI